MDFYLVNNSLRLYISLLRVFELILLFLFLLNKSLQEFFVLIIILFFTLNLIPLGFNFYRI